MRKHIGNFMAVACLGVVMLGLSGCTDPISRAVRRDLTALEANLQHPGDWTIDIDQPSLMNHQDYSATLRFNGDKTGQSVVVSKDRYGQVSVSVRTASWLGFYIVNGHCVDGSSGGMCHIAKQDEWEALYADSIDAAMQRGADI